MTANKHARALRRKHKALKDTTRGGNARAPHEREEFFYVSKATTDSRTTDTADAITDFDETF